MIGYTPLRVLTWGARLGYAGATGGSLQFGKRMDLRTLEPVAARGEGYAVWIQSLPKSDRNTHSQAVLFYGRCIKTRATGH